MNAGLGRSEQEQDAQSLLKCRQWQILCPMQRSACKFWGMYLFKCSLSQSFLVTIRAGTAYREMKMTKIYFVCQYGISMIN